MAEPESNADMDLAAQQAKLELLPHVHDWNVAAISRWWEKWYRKAGHKRLGRVLLELTGIDAALLTQKTQKTSASTGKAEPGTRASKRSSSPFSTLSKSATLIRRAERTVLQGIMEGRIQDEEPITDRLIGAIEQLFNARAYAGIRWTAMTLTAHKPNAQEKRYGADLLGVLEVDLDDYSAHKGFLAQAKYLRNSDPLNISAFGDLKEQCQKMLHHSPASFVFLYQREGFSVLPAIAVASLSDARKMPELKRLSLVKFFEEHFDCFVGDPALYRPHNETLEELRRKVDARRALYLSGKLE